MNLIIPVHFVVYFVALRQEIGDLIDLGISLHVFVDVLLGFYADLREDRQFGEVQVLLLSVVGHLNVLDIIQA